MAKIISFGKIDVGLSAGVASVNTTPDPETPFRILLLGDFSGRANRERAESAPPLGERRPLLVDRDNYDEVLRRCSATLQLPVSPDARLTIRFNERDDFHPDRLVQQVQVFQALRTLRQQLSHASTFEEAAAKLKGWTPSTIPATSAEENRPGSGNLLEQILAGSANRPAEPTHSPGEVDWETFLRNIVAPHLVPSAIPRQAELVAQVDEAIGAKMRMVLHHPDFQALEAAWRGLDFLVRRVDTNDRLQIYLLDVSQAELAADLSATEHLLSTSTYRLLAGQSGNTSGTSPWAVVAGVYTFDQTPDDVQFLGRMARIARETGVPFLAAADPHIVGCDSLAASPDPGDWKQAEDAEGWQSLRYLPEARHLGLILPRFLLRLPYGKDASATEEFPFEEKADPGQHDDYLWGNPALAGVLLLAEGFSRHGWAFQPDMMTLIDGLPLHAFQQDGEAQLQPCAEAILSDRATERIMDAGLMPLQSLAGTDVVRLVRFQSIADPIQSLAGRWQDACRSQTSHRE